MKEVASKTNFAVYRQIYLALMSDKIVNASQCISH